MTAVWQIIRTQYRHDRLAFAIGILAALVPAAAGLLLLGVSGWFITAAAVAGLSGAFLNIFVPSAIIRALAILRTGGRYGERLLTHEATFRFLTRLRNQLFAGFTTRRKRGERSAGLLNRLTVDIDALDLIYLRLVVPFVVVLVLVTALIVWWATISGPVLTFGIICLSAWLGLLLSSGLRGDRKDARRADTALEAMRLRSADLVTGRRDLSVYGGLETAADTVISAETRLQSAERADEKRALKLTVLSGLLGQVFLAVFLVFAILGAVSGDFGVAFAVGIVLVVLALPEVVNLLLPGLARLPRVSLAAGRTGGLLNDPSERPSEPKNSADGSKTGASHTSLCFENVTFRYPGAVRNVLSHVSFDVKAGEVLAIAGKSGCGKSTIAALSARLLEPGDGRIFLDGDWLAGVTETKLRQKVCVLGQRPYLFNDTVAVNLRIARANASEAELWASLEKAALSDRIAASSKGLETVLGEGGLGLSGGERRRLSLARAFLTQPTLYVLDEMTEGLDQETAEEVLNRFFAARGTASVLLIAHKKRELARADRVLTLDI